jgi:hypothetical protein
MAIGSISRLARCNGGAAAVEFAIIAWALIFVCLGVIEFGRGLHVRNEMAFAADHAARMLLTDPTVSDVRLKEEVENWFMDSGSADFIVEFGPVETDAAGLKSRTMLLQYPFSLLIPKLSDTITLTVSRRVPVG